VESHANLCRSECKKKGPEELGNISSELMEREEDLQNNGGRRPPAVHFNSRGGKGAQGQFLQEESRDKQAVPQGGGFN